LKLAYLHGFASGPGSTKAQFFRARLAELGLTLEIPDLAPDFTHMTVTSMLAIVENLVARGPGVLLGSSLGGYLARLRLRPALGGARRAGDHGALAGEGNRPRLPLRSRA
jgi:hypothetical protein